MLGKAILDMDLWNLLLLFLDQVIPDLHDHHSTKLNLSDVCRGFGIAVVQREIKWEGAYWLKPLPLHGCMAAWLHQLEIFLVDLVHHDDSEEITLQ
jgi:hypothetical protein